MDSVERGMNPVAMTIINPRKEYWPSRGSKQPPPVLKSTTLPTELLGLCGLTLKQNDTIEDAPPGGLSGERVGLMTWWLRVRSPVEETFLSCVFSPLTSAEACGKSSRWLWKEKLC